MTKRFEGVGAKTYIFREGEEERPVVAIYIGGRRAGFIEFDAARRLVDRIHDLCDDHERQLREEMMNG